MFVTDHSLFRLVHLWVRKTQINTRPKKKKEKKIKRLNRESSSVACMASFQNGRQDKRVSCDSRLFSVTLFFFYLVVAIFFYLEDAAKEKIPLLMISKSFVLFFAILFGIMLSVGTKSWRSKEK